MVVVLDLEGDRPDDPLNVNGSGYSSGPAVVARTSPQPESEEDRQRPNPNIGGFSAVLSCYPIVSQIARSIDLNTLHSLSPLRSADTTYQRVWTWRTRYSTYLGGIGTGIGEGNEGVKCGRGENCLAMQVIDVELDCDAEDMAALLEDDGKGGKAGIVKGIGYLRQEIEGIGGFLKKKIKKRVKLGAPVEEWEDEREKAQYLAREARGDERSWCGWCSRVIPGKDDEDESKTPRRRSGVRKVPSYQAYP
ncbi:MAG: hypothetical protein M1833_005242 [Piccolia ochrophora]|nr:MAG: hypothetical protein M1833_005242 [Piccolia ochrophora]